MIFKAAEDIGMLIVGRLSLTLDICAYVYAYVGYICNYVFVTFSREMRL